MLPLMPFALELFDLQDYDLVLSSESGPAKGVITRPDALHMCYCHSPMRYIWDQFHVYQRGLPWPGRALMATTAPLLRAWDVTTATRVDAFVANSAYVANRIRRFYDREATVIHPPVAVDDFTMGSGRGEFYLYAGQLTAYKRPDIAVRACSETGRKLVVIGEGEQAAYPQNHRRPQCSIPRTPAFPRITRTLVAVPRSFVSRRRGFRHPSGGSNGIGATGPSL